jgi:hypothetical protein
MVVLLLVKTILKLTGRLTPTMKLRLEKNLLVKLRIAYVVWSRNDARYRA